MKTLLLTFVLLGLLTGIASAVTVTENEIVLGKEDLRKFACLEFSDKPDRDFFAYLFFRNDGSGTGIPFKLNYAPLKNPKNTEISAFAPQTQIVLGCESLGYAIPLIKLPQPKRIYIKNWAANCENNRDGACTVLMKKDVEIHIKLASNTRLQDEDGVTLANFLVLASDPADVRLMGAAQGAIFSPVANKYLGRFDFPENAQTLRINPQSRPIQVEPVETLIVKNPKSIECTPRDGKPFFLMGKGRPAGIQNIGPMTQCTISRKAPEFLETPKIYKANTLMALVQARPGKTSFVIPGEKSYFCPAKGDCVSVDAAGVFEKEKLQGIRVAAGGGAPATAFVKTS